MLVHNVFDAKVTLRKPKTNKKPTLPFKSSSRTYFSHFTPIYRMRKYLLSEKYVHTISHLGINTLVKMRSNFHSFFIQVHSYGRFL